MNEAEKLLAVTENGPVNHDPLTAWGFRFYPATGHWRRIQKFHERLPLRVSRAAIAREVQVPEQVIATWEATMRTAAVRQDQSAAELLQVGPGGPVNLDPLARWQLRYYPQSKLWRRTRSHRNEVSREDVARKVGVSEDLLAAWESAVSAASMTGDGGSKLASA